MAADSRPREAGQINAFRHKTGAAQASARAASEWLFRMPHALGGSAAVERACHFE
jgi:hypothetical protein